jgi:hypothetical protein
LGILEHGLPPLPSPLVPEQGAAVAAWRGDRHGCVLFTRVINDGMDGDADVAVVERAEDGSWGALAWGGCPWPDETFTRPRDGAVTWVEVATHETGLRFHSRDLRIAIARGETPDDVDFGGEPEIVRMAAAGEFGPDRLARQRAEWAAFDALVASGLTIADFRWVLGIAPERVAAIEVERAGERLRLPIDSPVGAFVIGIEGPGQATMQPLDADDRPVGPSEWA